MIGPTRTLAAAGARPPACADGVSQRIQMGFHPPRGACDWMWAIKPFAYLTLRAIAPWGGIGFLLLAAAMSLTAFGGLQHRRWGWTLAVAIFVVNALADAARLIAGDVLEGLIGTLAAGAIVYALLRPNVSGVFAKRT